MIRRDYILRMLAEFFEVLSRLRSLQKSQNWQEAQTLADEQFQQLINGGFKDALELSETELLARLIKGEPTLAVREKTLLLATILKETGDIKAGRGELQEAQIAFLKGLNILLGALARDEVGECPAFVPRVEGFLAALGDATLPLSTQALLMQHYERCGEFARAEDALFSMLEDQPQNTALLHLGLSFYQRLQSKTDRELETGNLPRPELKAGLAQVEAHLAALAVSQTASSV